MDTSAIAALTAVVFLFLMAFGVWIGVSLALGGMLAYALFNGLGGAQYVGFLTFNTLTSYEYVSMPLFVFMATILANSGVSSKLYEASALLMRRAPGGLLHANVLGSAMFSSICGSTAATCAAMSSIAMPELEKRNYPRPISIGSLAAGGTLGLMIPPSIAFIVYGVLTETSIGHLFMAGVVPGITLAVLFMTYIAIRSIIRPLQDIVDVEKKKPEILPIVMAVLPVLLIFGAVVGSIYMGITTAVEAGALGCTGSLIVAAATGNLNRTNLRTALSEAINITVMIFLVLLGGTILGHGMTNLGVPQQLIELILEFELTQFQFLLVLTVFYLILGCFLDGAAMMAVTLPIVFPAVVAMEINPVWFGVIMVLFNDMAAITPPVGVNLFVMRGVTKAPMAEICWGTLPFVLLLLLAELLFFVFPQLVLFLPSRMM